jgi:hypothetical protein
LRSDGPHFDYGRRRCGADVHDRCGNGDGAANHAAAEQCGADEQSE